MILVPAGLPSHIRHQDAVTLGVELRTARAEVVMYYEPKLSVNHAYRRGNPAYGHCGEATAWLTEFRLHCNQAIIGAVPAIGQVTMDLAVFPPRRRGRMPDTGNFRKLPEDVLAAALEVDDACFGGTNVPAVRSDRPRIVIMFVWQYVADQSPSQKGR